MEKRFVDLNTTFDDETRTIEGYAVTYDSRSEPIGGKFVEVIERRALDGVDFDETYLFYQHDPKNVLASVKAGTLSLTVTEKGLHFRAQLPDTSLGRDVYELIKRGDLRHMSFGFVAAKDSWDVRSEPPVRKIERFDRIQELSIVTFPAYKETHVSARALETLEECLCCRDELNKSCELLNEAKQILKEIDNA